MAIAVASQSTAAFTGSNLVITKPTGLAVGDLMVAVITQVNTTGISSPAGWTQYTNKASVAGSVFILVDYKIADAADVAATNFTWLNGSGNNVAGAILRVTGSSTSTPMSSNAKDGTPGATTTPSFSSSVTPLNPSSLILFCLGSLRSAGAAQTASGYAVTTDNPTWTEVFDFNDDLGGPKIQGSFAYAIRTQTTATGNATVTMSQSCDEFSNIMVVVNPVFATPAGAMFMGAPF